MHNYLIHIIKNEVYKPCHYNPQDGITITADYVAQFFGCQLVRGLKGMPLIIDCWSTRKLLDTIGTVKESIPLGCFQDIYQCLHFADNMADEEDKICEDTYTNEKHELPRCACHCQKNFSIKDGFNKRWKACI
jgi:hypothetical protein